MEGTTLPHQCSCVCAVPGPPDDVSVNADMSPEVEMCAKKFIVIVDDSKLCDESALSYPAKQLSRIFVQKNWI